MGLAERRHHERRVKEKTLRYRDMKGLIQSAQEDALEEGGKKTFSAKNLPKETLRTLGKCSARHGCCRCGRDHGICSNPREAAKHERHVLDREREEIELGYQVYLGLDIPEWMAAKK